AANRLQRPEQQLVEQRIVGKLRQVLDRVLVRYLLHVEGSFASAGRGWLARSTTKVVADLVPRDRRHPSTKGIAGGFLAKAGEMAGDGREYFLQQVTYVLFAHAPPPAPRGDQGGV